MIKKSAIFDNVIKNNLDLLNKYPILMVEYNNDASKKQGDEMIKSSNSLDKYDNESLSIYSCIFENKYEISYDNEVIGKKSSRVYLLFSLIIYGCSSPRLKTRINN